MKTSVAPLLLAAVGARAQGFDVDLTNSDSIKSAARQVAFQLMSYYKGNLTGQTPGILPGPPPAGPYYWWEGGAMWGTMVDYWHYTGDDSYNKVTTDALIFQAEAPANAYMPRNWTASLGNDDQGFWAMSAMRAAETGYPDPPSDKPQWLALAQAVFNTQVPRWDPASCNGGLHWQIPTVNKGYDYKNTIANGILFNLGARLARYTGNDTYAQWAVKAYEWTQNVGYITNDYDVYDGAFEEVNCTNPDKAQFSYNAAVLLQGAAFMYNYTAGKPEQAQWQARLNGLVNRTIEIFFPDGIIVEVACELTEKVQCNTDQLSFKGYMLRWMADAAQLAPFIRDTLFNVIKSSTQAAVKSCQPGGTCGFRWNSGSYDGLTGAGQQMSALAALSSFLLTLQSAKAPLTGTDGGTSKGDAGAGAGANQQLVPFGPLGAGDKAGAGILTAVVLACMVGTFLWMASAVSEHQTRGLRTWRRAGGGAPGMFAPTTQAYEKPPEQAFISRSSAV